MAEIKEKRCANFTNGEMDLLVEIVMRYKNGIENKRTDATIWKSKNEDWESITNELNSVSGNFQRTVRSVRAQYETIKKDLRKKCARFTNKRKPVVA